MNHRFLSTFTASFLLLACAEGDNTPPPVEGDSIGGAAGKGGGAGRSGAAGKAGASAGGAAGSSAGGGTGGAEMGGAAGSSAGASFFIIEVGVFDVGCDCLHVLGKVLARVSVI